MMRTKAFKIILSTKETSFAETNNFLFSGKLIKLLRLFQNKYFFT